MGEPRPDKVLPLQPDCDNLLEETIRVWEPIAGRRLTYEEARQIQENVVGFFRTLIEWSTAGRVEEDNPPTEERAA